MSYYVIPEIEQALIVFAQYPEAGKVKPRLAADIGDEAAARVYEAMLMKQLRMVAGMQGVSPYVFYRPEEMMDEIEEWLSPFSDKIAMAAQMGETVGERMRLAFKRIFSRNTIRKAIIISEDCPQIDEQVLVNGFGALDEKDFVIGPATNGGCYLLGMKSLQPWVFDEVPWAEEKMLDALLSSMNTHQTSYALLPELKTVQTAADLNTVWPEWRNCTH